MVALVSLIIGLSKGGLGGLLGGLATPLMALVMPADQVIGLLLPILMTADVFAVWMHWKRWDWRLARLLIPGSIVGVTVATVFITNAPTNTLKTALGLIVLIFAIYRLLEKRLVDFSRYQGKDWHGMVAGTIAGFTSTLAHTGGPPITIYLLMQEVTPRVFIATSAIFFMILNWIKVPYYLYAGLFDLQRLISVIWLAPLLPLGVWVGKQMGDRINKETFEKLVVWLLIVTALLLIIR
jgi:uncharacterized membrane protein YfcA